MLFSGQLVLSSLVIFSLVHIRQRAVIFLGQYFCSTQKRTYRQGQFLGPGNPLKSYYGLKVEEQKPEEKGYANFCPSF